MNVSSKVTQPNPMPGAALAKESQSTPPLPSKGTQVQPWPSQDSYEDSARSRANVHSPRFSLSSDEDDVTTGNANGKPANGANGNSGGQVPEAPLTASAPPARSLSAADLTAGRFENRFAGPRHGPSFGTDYNQPRSCPNADGKMGASGGDGDDNKTKFPKE
jgi:hypothetical protein